MAHIYRTTEWQGNGGQWYVNDIEEIGGIGSYWWTPVRMLNISPCDYVKFLIDKFNVNKIHYNRDKNVLVFSFKTQTEARKYKNYINKIARDKHYMV